jgi:outer membrane biosynthesis protein TonB
MKLQVTACDIDKKFPAKTYTITASDGRTITKDLCEEHAEPFEEWLEEAEVVGDAEPVCEPEPKPTPEPKPAPAKKAPAKQAPAEAPAKKTASRRRPKVVSLEEIEAKKG